MEEKERDGVRWETTLNREGSPSFPDTCHLISLVKLATYAIITINNNKFNKLLFFGKLTMHAGHSREIKSPSMNTSGSRHQGSF